jgi:hypothetical protein
LPRDGVYKLFCVAKKTGATDYSEVAPMFDLRQRDVGIGGKSSKQVGHPRPDDLL